MQPSLCLFVTTFPTQIPKGSLRHVTDKTNMTSRRTAEERESATLISELNEEKSDVESTEMLKWNLNLRETK